MNYVKHKTWIQYNTNKDLEREGRWSNWNHPAHLNVINQRSWLTVTRDKRPSPIKCRGKKLQNKPIPEPKTKTEFHCRCTDLEGYTSDLGPRLPENFSRTTKELEQYHRETYSDSFQTAIMTGTAATFLDPEMPNITDLGTERPKTDGEITYLKKRIPMRPSSKSWGRRMSMNQTYTIYKTSLWAKRMNNYNRRGGQTPLSRRSRLTKTQ